MLVVGFRAELYKIAIEDPTYAKMVLTSLEPRRDVRSADDLDEIMSQLESHMKNQTFKAVATLSTSNATMKAKGKDGAVNEK